MSLKPRQIGMNFRQIIGDRPEFDLAARQRVAEVQPLARTAVAKMVRLRESKLQPVFSSKVLNSD